MLIQRSVVYTPQHLEPYPQADVDTHSEYHDDKHPAQDERNDEDGNVDLDDGKWPAIYTLNESPSNFSPDHSHLEELLDGLYLAFADDYRQVAALRTHEGEPFSHVVRIEYVPDDAAVSMSEFEERCVLDGAPHTLHLSCPASALNSHGDGEERRCTQLNLVQLLAARHFLSRVLSYRSADTTVQPQQQVRPAHTCADNLVLKTRLLLVAPPGRSVDVMSVVVCYLASMSGKPAEMVVESIPDDFDEVWLGNPLTMLGPGGVEYVEAVARHPYH